MIYSVVLAVLFSVYSQSYYVATNGSDSSSCGSQRAPCATLNQIFTNNPGSSFTIIISSGTYPTKPIALQKDAVVIFQGTGNPTIVTSSWSSGVFLSNTETSGFEFHDLTINVNGSGSDFTTLNGNNSAGFFNVPLIFSALGDNFIGTLGGSIALSNITLSNADFDSYLIFGSSRGNSTSIVIKGSTFSNVTIGDYGALLVFDAYGDANITLDSSKFNNVFADYVFIGFWAEDENQTVIITNNAFQNIDSYLPSIYAENDYQCVIYVANTSWNASTAYFVSGALETLGSDDYNDHNITLSNLTFINCSGPYAGALLVAFNSLNLSDSNFAANSGDYGNDLVQGLDSYSDSFGESIKNSYSTSAQPRAVIWNLSTGKVTDISDQLPDPPRKSIPVVHISRDRLSASPKTGRLPKKKQL